MFPYLMSIIFIIVLIGDGITEDLPRINICSIETSELISIDRGLLHSPNYPQALGQYLTCKKQLFVPHEARLRLFMLEKSIEYSHELNIYLLNQTRTLVRNELLDINITNQLIQFELKTNHLGDGHFLLYFQIDSRISEYAPFTLELDKNINNDNQHGKTLLSRDWRIIIGCIIGILLLLLIIIAIIFTVIRITKRRRVRSRRYLKSEDDHRQRLNAPTLPSPDRHHRHHGKDLPIEQPYLTSSSPTILPSSSLSVNGNHNRPNSASSTTSSIIIHQINDNLSDRESLIKPINQIQSHSNPTNTDIDNFYEEIKEQQQQTALALGKNDIKGDIVNPYLEAKKIEPKKLLFQGNKSSQPIRDHNESESRYQRPSSSHNTEPSNIVNEEIKHSKKSSPIIPPKRMDIKHSAANAASLHLIDNNDGKDN
ncbi:unnamed protein product [Rotaria sp. Silwood1]|nr:unnamed protein product [Rotaria sp. Silwood1]CAF3531992.1 unnamed protein product [Rotaria sp. Silwood1]CAF3613414.1 unnamed protein product [Rotaria sp. Silwood1]CAF4706798.1 unnamed protein product [Rotaria sp. Silwood1]CAF4787573.1 unnamed protein product [Rotaria sp. Silwood1]